MNLWIDHIQLAARKAHPAFAVDELDSLHESLVERGAKITEDGALPGVRRFYAEDLRGNRLEFLADLA